MCYQAALFLRESRFKKSGGVLLTVTLIQKLTLVGFIAIVNAVIVLIGVD